VSPCPLCSGAAGRLEEINDKIYLKCKNCQSIFLDKNCHLEPDKEKQRYLEHNNNVNDPAYQNFVKPITSSILSNFTPRHKGLDYGAGTGPIITKVLCEAGYNIKPFDPYFHNQAELLNSQYDYIACCEVMEHFRNPLQELDKLIKLLKPNGKLYCMTVLFDGNADFRSWHYKNDPTHVFFYSRKSIFYIKEQFKLADASIEGRLITFTN
jgi:SAM-dependent methyltransferase